jgi:hypothetical protein
MIWFDIEAIHVESDSVELDAELEARCALARAAIGDAEWPEMAVLTAWGHRDFAGEAHGKEGVNGSSPLEGFSPCPRPKSRGQGRLGKIGR